MWVRVLMLFLLNVDGILKNKNRTHIRVFREKKSSILVSATHFLFLFSSSHHWHQSTLPTLPHINSIVCSTAANQSIIVTDAQHISVNFVYIYIERERERERLLSNQNDDVSRFGLEVRRKASK